MTTTTTTTSSSSSGGARRQVASSSVSTVAGSPRITRASTDDATTQAAPFKSQEESQKTPSDSGLAVDLNSNHMQPNVISSAARPPQPQPQPQPHPPEPEESQPRPTALAQPPAQSRQQQTSTSTQAANNQWLAQVATQTQLGVRQRMSQASDQLDLSLRQLYASASSIAADVRPPSYHNIPGIVPYYAGRSIGPPPSYDDVTNPYASPPSYHSLFGQMREARKSSRGLLDLLRRLLIILVSTLGCTLLVAFMILIPFSMIIVGAVYIDECRIEHIPAFLLVGGLVWASKNILHCYAQCRQMPSSSASSVSLSHESADGEPTATVGRTSEGTLANIYLGVASPSRGSSNASSSSNSLARHLEVAMAGGDDGARGDSNNNNTTLAPSIGETCDPFTNLHLDAQHHHHNGHQTLTSFSVGSGLATTLGGDTDYRNNHRRQTGERHSSRRLKSSICESLLNCVLFGWFIAGCVIVFRNYEPDFENPASLRYCHRTVYMYTFWLISSAILLLGLFIGCICCLMVSSAVASRHDETADLA